MRIRLLLLVVMTMFLATSCYVTRATHQEVMDSAFLGADKDFVITNFGLPDQKITEGDYEQWIYMGDQITVTRNLPTRTTTTATATPYYRYNGSVNQVNANVNTYGYGGGSVSQTRNSYVRLLFKDGKVISWDSSGVDLSVKERSTGGTIAAVLGVIASVILTVVLALNTPV